ncbi:MAG: hypothetical protein IPL95_07705 [Saprospiraceae bacterium]|nr:hypothetical protein [Saprospiraceae bacterium]
MKKLKFSTLSLSFKSVIMAMMVFFAVNNANAWVGEGAALNISVTKAQELKASIDPTNPEAVSVVKIQILNNMINSLTAGVNTADAFYSCVVFKSPGISITSANAVDASGLDTKAISKELYDWFQ